MAVTIPDTSQLSSTEKIALMERLWQDLSASPDLEPPAWHDAVLKNREQEWENRDRVSQDWLEAKEELRRELR
ncbi:MAG: addiction module protein [Verrucomicrobiota bacterium]